MEKLKQLCSWIETEAVIAEHTAEHGLEDLKAAFLRGLLALKDTIHNQKQDKVAAAFTNAINAPAVDPNQTALPLNSTENVCSSTS